VKPVFVMTLALAGCAPQTDFTFQNTSITLPADTTMLPPGPNVELVSANCSGCHSAEMILTQPRLTRAAWEGEVAKMIKVYRAPVDEAAVPQIVEYLVATNARLASPAKK